MQYFPIVHEHKQYFNRFIVTYTEHYFQYYILSNKYFYTTDTTQACHFFNLICGLATHCKIMH